jgi:putative nucleotidyltransferase with HDIG domain
MTVAGSRGRALAHAGYVPTDDAARPAFRFLQQLADDLSRGDVSFPTFIDATLRVRRALHDANVDAGRVALAIGAEPLLAARIMHVANSPGLGAHGAAVGDLKNAILRLGYSNVQSLATAVAMAQLVVAKDMRPFLRHGETVWRHSLDVAAIAHLLARKFTRLNPEEALFCGLVHDIGKFYLLSKVSNYPELANDAVALDAVLEEWHAAIGHAVLGAMDLSEVVLAAVAGHGLAVYPQALRTLTDVIVAANLLSHCPNPLNRDAPPPAGTYVVHEAMLELLDASAEQLVALVAALRS